MFKKEFTVKNLVFKDYKDKHKNERVFILGNGPSLAETDLNLLKNENTIAIQRISMIYDKYKEWKPTYYLFCSTEVKQKNTGKDWISSVQTAISEPSTISFIASFLKEYIDPHNNFNTIKWFHTLSETKPCNKGEITEDSFSKNIVDRIDKSGTTMNCVLQLAYHMGFSEIILLGVDLGFKNTLGTEADPNHFDKNYKNNVSNPYRSNHKIRNVHRLALSVFNKNKSHVKIYNASIKTVLDTYPIIQFNDYIKNNKIIERIDDLKKAKLFWKHQIYVPPKPDTLIVRLFKKIKKILKSNSLKMKLVK